MTLRDTVTPADLEALRNREVTGRDLAKKYGVTEYHFSRTFPGSKIGKIPGKLATHKRDKRYLRMVRNNFRDNLAIQVRAHKLTIKDAAKRAHCSLRTMYRHLEKAPAHPTPDQAAF